MKRILTVLLVLTLSLAHAATVVTSTPGTWDLFKGTSKVSVHADQPACLAAADKLGAGAYTCRTITKVVVTGLPDPTGSATVSWAAPTRMADDSTPAVLSGFRVQWGPSPRIYNASEFTGSLAVNDPAATSATVTGLPLGLTYFVVRAIGVGGLESYPSFASSKVITADAVAP